MKGEKMLLILEKINSGLEHFVDLNVVYLMTPKGQQHTIDKKLRAIQKQRERDKIGQEEKRKFIVLVSKMKKQGLIKNENNNWILTNEGTAKLKKLREIFLRKKVYEKQEENIAKIISFDVPENRKKYREWLRSTLKQLGFRMLHKSVWVGNNKLPEEFLLDLKNFNLLNCVEIVGVTKSGTLKNITVES